MATTPTTTTPDQFRTSAAGYLDARKELDAHLTAAREHVDAVRAIVEDGLQGRPRFKGMPGDAASNVIGQALTEVCSVGSALDRLQHAVEQAHASRTLKTFAKGA